MKTRTQKENRTRSNKSLAERTRHPARERATSPDGARSSRLKIKSILVPIDFSAESEKALAYAVPFARQFGAKLVLLHVVEPVATPDFAKAFPLAVENDRVMEGCKGHLKRIVRDCQIDPRLVAKTLVRLGRAFNEIANAARTLKVDVIIISTHGFTGLKHAFLGSTTERVVQHAPCPVLVVRPHEHEFVVNRD